MKKEIEKPEEVKETSFSLQKLEMAFPYLEAAEKKDPKALVSLAAVALADDNSLKLISAGNTDLLSVFKDKVYEMPYEEVAVLLANFIRGSKRFMLIMSGLSPEEALQTVKKQDKMMRESQDL